MSRHNSCFVIGNLGGNPEERGRGPKGGVVVGFTVAENVQAFDESTQKYETIHTNWFRSTAFGALGDRILKTLKKGDRVLVQGRMKVAKYQSKTGEEKSGFEIVAEDVSLCKPLAAGTHESAERESASINPRLREEEIPF